MKAWFVRGYGGPDVLHLSDAPAPALKPDEVLVRVRATTVNSGDVRIRGCDFPPGMRLMGRLALGWNKPRQPVLGTECAGVVETAGAAVTRFRSGDAVYAFAGMQQGCHAEYVVMQEQGALALLPRGLDFNAAAALSFAGTTALHFLRKAQVQPDEKILVLGASGAVGLALIQLGLHAGAAVTASASTRNLSLLLDHGADRAIDYTTTDIAGLSDQFDIIADTAGTLGFAAAQQLLKRKGRYLAIAGGVQEMLSSLVPATDGKRMIAGPAGERVDDVVELGRLAASGHYRPHIDRVFDFAEMSAAHAYVDTRRKRGSVVIELP